VAEPDYKKRRRLPTLAWALIITAILGVIIGILLPAFEGHGPSHKYLVVRMDMANLAAAIQRYESAYGKLPISEIATTTSDFTFGTFETSDDATGITNASGYQANNSELMAIIMDLDKFPSGRPTINADHKYNTKNIVCLATRMAKDTNSPGLGPDYVYRDPWGHPYIITIDLNGDNKCRDAFYRLASVSETASAMGSHAYLTRPSPPPYSSDEARDSFEVPNATVIVWSLGPDGKADKTQKANEGVNKDNITSW
jgi:hypothetical protein